MKRVIKSLLMVIMYFFVYYVADIMAVLSAGLIYGAKHGTKIEEISSEALVSNVQQFYIQNINIFIVLASFFALFFYWAIFRIKKRSLKNHINLEKISWKVIGLCSLLGIAISIFLSSFLMLTSVHEFFPEHSQALETIIGQRKFLITLLSVGIFIPVFEEILFRGLIFNELRNSTNLFFAVIIQSLIFGIVHVNTLQVLYTFAGGIILALIYIRVKSIWAPILIHVLWNSTSVSLGWFNAGGIWSSAALILISIAVIFYTMKKLMDSKKDEKDLIFHGVKSSL